MAEVAGFMLAKAGDFLAAVEVDNEDAKEALKANGRVCRAMAAALPTAPFADSAAVLSSTDLGGRFFTRGQRVWTNATVAAFLLSDTARIIETARAENSNALKSLAESATTLREIASLLDLAPGGRVGSRLNEILPYLRQLRSLEHSSEIPALSSSALDLAMADPEFQALSEDAFQAKFGRELKDSHELTQIHWTRRLAGIWLQRSLGAVPLDQGDVEHIRHALAHPRHDWCRAPLVGGKWTDLQTENATAVLCLVSAYNRAGPSGTPFALAWFCDRVRSRALKCFGGKAILVETQGQPEGGTCGIASFVITDHGASLVSGVSDWLHDLNAQVGPHLNDAEARLDYLRLFLNCVRNDGERFQPLEGPGDLDDRTEDENARNLCAAHARPIAAEGFDEEGRWLYRAVVLYAGTLFSSAIAMSPDGQLEMIEDTVIAEEIAVPRERMIGPFVVLNGA